ncbi:NAC domain-containing protein 100-like [Prunus avium]|uniref:NAC domain-containing protein 100-like n=1 Tax=Prunus avium TaxID=42229 RepID=A0A6P5TSI9_PRUAV|nr:NAC domain-containing protein 100-like [Prunus avium]
MADSRHVSLAFRFHPTDQEIIRSILYKMVVEREPLNTTYKGIVHDEDLFGTKEPWKIWEDYGGDQLYDQDLYFLCQLKRLNFSGSRTHRKVGCEGSWKEGVASKLVYDGNANPIGRIRQLRYKNPKSEHHGGWYLDEYSLFVGDDGHDQTTPGINFVICRLRKNHRSSRLRAGVDKKTNKAPQQINESKRKSMNVIINIDDEEVPHGCSKNARTRESFRKRGSFFSPEFLSFPTALF